MNINLNLAGHNLHLAIPAEQESPYRLAGKQLTDRFTYYRALMPKDGDDKIWMYVALEAAVNLHADKRDKALEPIAKKIEELNALFEQPKNS